MSQIESKNLFLLFLFSVVFLFPQHLHGKCDPRDTDCDDDGYSNISDNCVYLPNGPDLGTCADGDRAKLGAPCTFDSYCGKQLSADCQMNQEDEDSDGMGDVCDPCPAVHTDQDYDDDCTPDSSDGCDYDPNKISPGICGCGIADTDTDGDGTPDCNDDCPTDPDKIFPGVCGCSVADVDTDGDFIPDCTDNCAEDSSKTDPGICGCGTVDLSGDLCSTGAGLPDTGQQKCYDNFSEIVPCPEEGEDFFGQDANYHINPASFTKLDISGNPLLENAVSWSMVRDNVSGLIWQAQETGNGSPDNSDPHDPDNSYTWCYYYTYPFFEENGGNEGVCENDYDLNTLTDTRELLQKLNQYPSFGSRSWRMPTVEELSRLLQSIDSTPLAHSFFPNMQPGTYWAGTTYSQDASGAWSVDFGTLSDGGTVESADKGVSSYAIVVSGEIRRDRDRFSNNMDGTITDRSTGLMWLAEPADLNHDGLADNLTVEEALTWAEGLEHTGFSDWRLPNRNELQSLVDYTRYSPALDNAYFPGIHDDSSNPGLRYWSSTTALVNGSTVRGNMVEFADGKVGLTSKGLHYSAKAVRGGVVSEPGKLSITVPAQGQILNYGVGLDDGSTTIKWNPGVLPFAEQVYIYVSYDGGKTFDLISYFGQWVAGHWLEFDYVTNSGEYDWMPEADSNNCVIKIVPTNPIYAHLATSQGLFSVRELNPVYRVSYDFRKMYCGVDNSEYIVSLETNNEEGIFSATAIWAISEGDEIAEVGFETGIVTSLVLPPVNGWFEVSTAFIADNYKRHLFFVKDNNSPAEEDGTWNHIPAYAGNMFVNQFYLGRLDPAGDIDYFTFSLATDSMVNLGLIYKQNFCPSGLPDIPVNIEVLDVASGETVAADVTDNLTILPMGLPAGDYYVKLTGDSEVFYPSPYFLSYMVDASVSYAANPMTPTSLDSPPISGSQNIHSGFINNLLDKALFSFVIASLSNVEIGFIPGSDVANFLIEVKNEYDETVFSNRATEQLPVTIAGTFEPGAYTVEVTAIDRVDAFREFRIYKEVIGQALEEEPNDSTDTANLLPIGTPVSGRTASFSDYDFYTFELESPRYLNLSLFCPHSDKDFTLTLFKGSIENEIDVTSTTDGNNLSLHMGLSIGTYFLRVSPSGDAETVHYYNLLLQNSLRSSLEVEANNTPRFANTIEADTPRTGRIYSATDVDYFAFGLTPDGGTAAIQVDFSSFSATASYKVSLVDVNRAELETATSAGGSDPTLNTAALPAGNYFLKVESDGVEDPYTHYELKVTSGDGTLSGLKSIVSIEVNGEGSTMTPGDPESGSQALTAEAFYSNTVPSSHDPATFIWLSLDPTVASVNSSGVVTAVTNGNTAIIASHPDIDDVVGRFDLVVGTADPGFQHHGNLILVAGGGPDESDNLYNSTKYLSELVYSRFKSRFFSDEDIYFLSPTTGHDIDGDGFDDDIVDDLAADPTLAKFSAAVSWAASVERNTDGPLYIYLLDHGSTDAFKINTGEYLSSGVLKGLLDTFEATGRQVVVVIEACKSGSFVLGGAADNLVSSNEDRVVVTSTGELDTYIQLDGIVSFSQFFVDRLLTGDTIRQAYDSAVLRLSGMGLPYSSMVPQLAMGAGSNADQLILGGDFGIGSLFPEFVTLSSGVRNITANTLQDFSATIAELDAVEMVWATVRGPDYQVPVLSTSFEAPVVEQEVIIYQKNSGPDHQGSSDNFVYNGSYKVSCYAMNSNGNVALAPAPLTLNVTGGQYLSGDVNGDLDIDLSDGIITLQELSGQVSGQVLSNYPISGADVDGDQKLGLAEAVYILQMLSR